VSVDSAQSSGSYGSSRTVLVGSLVGVLLAALGISVLIDKQGGQKLLASIYELLGNAAGAEALRNGQGDQFFAKLLLAAIALLVGVGGIWLLFTAASSLVERLRPGVVTASSRWSSSHLRLCCSRSTSCIRRSAP